MVDIVYILIRNRIIQPVKIILIRRRLMRENDGEDELDQDTL
jgi:hypothetical protein